MHALVAEANVVTRVMLTRILQRAGFEVEELRDELAAACLLHSPDAPELALLALDTLLVDFEEVCAAMRAAKPEVFIVALVPKTRRHEAGIVLDAGADDFLLKPATVQEAEARLRVIQQTLAAFDGSPASAIARQAAQAEPPPALAHFLTGFDFANVFEGVFNQLGLDPARTSETNTEAAAEAPVFTAWAPMLLRQGEQAHWLNLRLDLDEDPARRLFAEALPGKAFSEEMVLNLLQEIMSLTQDALRLAVLQYDDTQVYLPMPPFAFPTTVVPPASRLASAYAHLRRLGLWLADDVRLLITLTLEPVPLEETVITRLRPLDVLAHDIQSAEYQTVLLRAGTMLNEAYIDKIQAFIHSKNLAQTAQVFHPPKGTDIFLRELL